MVECYTGGYYFLFCFMARPQEQPIIWETAEYPHRKKTSDWFWALGIISIALATGAIFLKNFLFAFLIIIGAFTIALYASQKPRHVRFEVGERGIRIGDMRYPYATLESFGILEKPSGTVLILKSEKAMMPFLTIPLGDANPEAIRNFLLDYLPEEAHEESLSESIMEYLGF